MTFGSTFGRVFSPTFQPKSQAAGGWWLAGGIPADNCFAAYQAKGAGSYISSLVNMNTPGINDAISMVAPDWDTTTGWTFNGSDDYLQTTFIPDVVGGTSSMIVLYKLLGGRGTVAGSNSAPRGFRLVTISNTILYAYYGSLMPYSFNHLTTQFYTVGITRDYTYLDGRVVATSDNVGKENNRPVLIGANNNSSLNEPAAFCNCIVSAIALYTIKLTESQMVALTNAMNAL